MDIFDTLAPSSPPQTNAAPTGDVFDKIAPTSSHDVFDQIAPSPLGPGISLAGTTSGLGTAAALAKGEIAQQQNRTQLVGGVPSATNGLPAEGTVYQPNQTLPTQNLPLSQQTAIQNAYQRQYGAAERLGFEHPTGATPQVEAGQEGLRSTAQIKAATAAGNSVLENLSGGIGRGVASGVVGPVKSFAPTAGNELDQDVAETYPTDPNSVAATVGQIAGGSLPMFAGGGGLALIGSGAIGQVRGEIAQRRAAGQQISTADELKAAAASAAINVGSAYIAQGFAKSFGDLAKRAVVDPALREALHASTTRIVTEYANRIGAQAAAGGAAKIADDAIKQHYYAPELSPGTQGVSEAMATQGAVEGLLSPIAALQHRGAVHGGPETRAPEAKPAEVKTPEQATIPAPDLKGVLNEPEAVKQTLDEAAKPEPATLPRLLEDQTPKYRVSDEHGNSTGVPLEFENATDKALYLASHPRKGKVSEQAAAWLEAQGMTPEEQQSRAADVRDHVEAHASMHEGGDTLPIPSLENHEAAATTPAPHATEPVVEASTKSAEASVPIESKGEEKAYLPSEKAHQEVLDEATPGAKEVSIPDHFDDVVDAAGKIGRTEVVGYSGGKGRGFFHEGRLFLNVDNPQNKTPEGKREVAMHEAAHAAQQTNPELLQQLADAAPESVKAQVREQYGRLYAKQEGQAASDAVLNRETVPMVVGKLMRSGRAFNEVFQSDRGLLARGVDALLTHVRSLTEKGRYHNQILASLKELKARTDSGAVAETAEQPSYLPGKDAAKKFWEDDVKEKAVKAGDAVSGAWEGIKRIFAPQTRTHEGLQASETWRTRNAELAQRYDRLNSAFGDARKVLDKAPQAVTRQMIDEVERGVPQTQTHLQPLADAMRSVLDDRLHQVQALGTGKLKQFVEDYFPHLWEDPKKAANIYAEMAAKGPLEGKKGFLKARTLPLFSDGIARGLVPVTENPVEAMMLRTREMDKFITAQQAMQEMDTNGLLRTIKASDPVPPGYAKIDDNIATTFAKPSRRGAVQISGYKVAPEAVANVVNNQLSPGLRGDKHFGGVFRGFLGAGNLLNSVQLGLSGFHLAMTTMDSATSKLALAFRNVGEGQFGKALGNAGKAATVFGPAIENVSRGNKMMKEWFHPGSTDPETAQLVYQMKQAGGRAKMDDFYHAGVAAKMTEAFRKGNYIGAALRAPLAGLELAGKPLMEKLVPRMKMGAFADMAKFELERLGPNAPDFEVRRAMTKAWDSVDNRMGQLVYDNLFWNKAAKDLAMASTRSVGWNLGTLRELGGGVLDFSKAGLNLARGRNAEFTHRMAYTAAMPVMAGMIGGMIHYLMTGKHPEELKDWFFPKSGSKDNTGHDVRYALPSYMKDVYSYARNPGETLKNKVHPLVHTVFDMLSNSDYYGAKIHNEDDPIMKQLTDVAKYGGKQLLPFSTREVPKLLSEGQGAKSLLPLIGVTPARKDISLSPAELTASEVLHAHIPPGRSQEQVEKSRTIGGLAAAFRNKTPEAIDDVHKAVAAGEINPSDIATIKRHVKNVGLSGAVKSMDMHAAMDVWAKASPEERQAMGPTMFQKLRATKAITREQKVGYLQTLQRDWADLKGTEQ